MTATGIEIWPFTPEWAQWLEYHRGSKTEARMLECLPFKDRPAKSFFAPAQFPPAKPDPAKLTPVKMTAEQEQITEAKPAKLKLSKEQIELVRHAEAKRQRADRAERKKLRRLATKTADVIDQALVDVNHNQRPRVADDELEVRYVEDPDDKLLVVDSSGIPMRSQLPTPKRYRLAELRDDPIGKMAKLGRLGIGADRDVRLMAARKWQELYNHAASHKGLDPCVDSVDGGTIVAIAETRLTAVASLGEASKRLGIVGEHMIYSMLAVGLSLEEYLKSIGILEGSVTHRRKVIDAYGEMLRLHLDNLAFQFGYRVKGKRARQMADRWELLAQFRSRPRDYDRTRQKEVVDRGRGV